MNHIYLIKSVSSVNKIQFFIVLFTQVSLSVWKWDWATDWELAAASHSGYRCRWRCRQRYRYI